MIIFYAFFAQFNEKAKILGFLSVFSSISHKSNTLLKYAVCSYEQIP